MLDGQWIQIESKEDYKKWMRYNNPDHVFGSYNGPGCYYRYVEHDYNNNEYELWVTILHEEVALKKLNDMENRINELRKEFSDGKRLKI